MTRLVRVIPWAAACAFAAAFPVAAKGIVVNQTDSAPLFDGRCGDDEWKTSTKIELPAQISLRLMHDAQSLFVCAKGKDDDYTVIDLYIEDRATGYLHNLHASAQLGERVYRNGEWSESEFWNHQHWSAFWVPYAGADETEDGPRTKFLKGSHRELQVLRRKFPGQSWKLMIGVSAVNHDGSYGAEFVYPENASDSDSSSWTELSFAGDHRR